MKQKSKTDLEISLESERYAGIYSLKSTNPNERKRSFATIMLIYSLADFFRKQNLQVSNSKNLFKVPKIAEQFEISDLYVNNYRLDVRLALKDEFYIPKVHYEFEILPDFYVVVSIDKNLKKPKFVGYIKPDDANKEDFNSKYYKVSTSDLKSMSDLLPELKNEKQIDLKSSEHRIFNNNIVSYIDDEADNYTITKILQHVLKCRDCRSELINFCGFEIIAKDSGKYSDILKDNSLDIVGAVDPENSDYSSEEQTIEFFEETQIPDSDFDVLQDDDIPSSDDYSSFETNDKENNQILLDGLFDNTMHKRQNHTSKGKNIIQEPVQNPAIPKEIPEENIEIIQENTEKDEIKLNNDKNDNDFLSGDIDLLQEVTDEKEENRHQSESLKDFLSKNNAKTQQENEYNENVKDLKSIPDEIFNDNYYERSNNISKTFTNNNIKKMKKTITDYNEYGQPVYSETPVAKPQEENKNDKKEDDVVSLEEIINETTPQEGAEETKQTESTQYIEVDSENYENEYNNQQPVAKSRKRVLILFVIFIFVAGCYFTKQHFDQQNKPQTAVEATNDIDKMDNNELEKVISQNVKNESKFVKLKSVNWVCNTSLLNDETFKVYLKTLDRRFKAKFKLNSNSILQAPYNNAVNAEILVTSLGQVKTSRIAQSSGVKEIDDIVLLSLKEAATNLKVSELSNPALNADEYYVKLVLKF